MNDYPTYLVHFGIKGQRWGYRRYQNEDGTLTPEGKKRAALDAYRGNKWAVSKDPVMSSKTFSKMVKKALAPTPKNIKKASISSTDDKIRQKAASNAYNKLSNDQRQENAKRMRNRTIGTAISTAIVGGAFAAKSFSDSIINYKAANAFLKDFDQKIPVSKLITSGTAKALIVAGTAAAATYGTIKLSQLISDKRKINKEYKKRKSLRKM